MYLVSVSFETRKTGVQVFNMKMSEGDYYMATMPYDESDEECLKECFEGIAEQKRIMDEIKKRIASAMKCNPSSVEIIDIWFND